MPGAYPSASPGIWLALLNETLWVGPRVGPGRPFDLTHFRQPPVSAPVLREVSPARGGPMMRSARAAAIVVAAALGVPPPCRSAATSPPPPRPARKSPRSSSPATRSATSQDILAVFGLRPGSSTTEDTIRAGTKRLYDKGWFTPNGIEIRTVERTDGRVNVILYVTELTNFIEEIKYNGAQHHQQDELEQLTGLRIRMPMSPHLNHQARLEHPPQVPGGRPGPRQRHPPRGDQAGRPPGRLRHRRGARRSRSRTSTSSSSASTSRASRPAGCGSSSRSRGPSSAG